MSHRSAAWSNASVLAFAGGADPLLKAQEAARALADLARTHNVQGPPMDILGLVRAIGIQLRAVNEVADARITAAGALAASGDHRNVGATGVFPEGTDGFTIEYNPNRPRGRLRFSLAHELAHACFPGVGDEVRHRTGVGAVAGADPADNWELELLCNVIASELLIPEEAVAGLVNIATDIDFIMETRRRWDVSVEALLRRLTRAVPRPMAMLAISRVEHDSSPAARLDYADVSDHTPADSPIRALAHGALLTDSAVFLRCVAVGQTVRGATTINGVTFAVQCVGGPPYPGARLPRMLALLETTDQPEMHPGISYVTGDLLDIGTEQPALFAHVASDASHAWGRFGVGASLSRAFPDAARAFRAWTIADRDNLRLGQVHLLDQQLNGHQVTVATMIAQQGFGGGDPVRLRYDALGDCLAAVGAAASATGAHVHLPRVGAGGAGGRWDVIADLIYEHLAARGVPVTVHTKPAAHAHRGLPR